MTAVRLSEILRQEKVTEAQTSLQSASATTQAKRPTFSSDQDAKDVDRHAFVSRLSHEVKTPLNAILGMSDMLLEENVAQEMIEPLTIIQQAAYGLDATLTNLLIALSPQVALDTIADDSYALIPFLQALKEPCPGKTILSDFLISLTSELTLIE